MQEIDIVGLLVKEIEWKLLSFWRGAPVHFGCEVNGAPYGLQGEGGGLPSNDEKPVIKRAVARGILRDFVTAEEVVGKCNAKPELTRREKLDIFQEMFNEYLSVVNGRIPTDDWIEQEKEKLDIDNYKVDLSDMPLDKMGDKNENRIRPGKVINAIIDGKCVKLRENTGVGSIDCVAIWEQLQE